MKTTIIALSLLTSLISAAPVSNGTVLIILNTGGGNISTQVTVPYGTLVDASSWPKSVGLIMRYGAYTPTVCQAFSDTAGKYRLGASFKNVIPGASFHTDKPRQIGSIFCSDSAGVKARIASTATSTSQSPIGTAHIQLNTYFEPLNADIEPYVQGSIPIAPSVNFKYIVPAGEVFKKPVCQAVSLVSTDGIALDNVWCQAYSDLEGVNRLGEAFTGNGSSATTLASDPLKDVVVGAFSCWTYGNGA